MRSLPILLAVPDHSFYEDAKVLFLSVVPLPKPVVHVAIGLAALAFSVYVLRRSEASWTALLPGLLLTMAMEAFDLHDDKMMINRYQWAESLKDLVVGNLAPFLIVAYHRRARRSDRDRGRRPVASD